MIKYIIHENYVKSKNDGDLHFIRGEQLISLYKLNRSECEIVRYGDLRPVVLTGTFVHLYPRYDGNYNIQKELDNNG